MMLIMHARDYTSITDRQELGNEALSSQVPRGLATFVRWLWGLSVWLPPEGTVRIEVGTAEGGIRCLECAPHPRDRSRLSGVV